MRPGCFLCKVIASISGLRRNNSPSARDIKEGTTVSESAVGFGCAKIVCKLFKVTAYTPGVKLL